MNIGERMKTQYEHRTRYFLPRRTYTIIRLDGKCFHTFTRGLNRPFDKHLSGLMEMTARGLMEEIPAELAYVQSDEISLLLTDFSKETTQSWFDGNIQKITSISSSVATAAFNSYMLSELFEKEDEHFVRKFSGKGLAYFDSRTFTIPDPIEVENYFIWRQQDATRNSIQMVAQSHYSQKETHKKNTTELQDLIHEKGDNWNDYPTKFRRGFIIEKDKCMNDEIPIFTQDRDYLRNKIPLLGGWNE